MSPELLLGGTLKKKSSDIYAFGMVIYEVSPMSDIVLSVPAYSWLVFKILTGDIPPGSYPPTTVGGIDPEQKCPASKTRCTTHV